MILPIFFAWRPNLPLQTDGSGRTAGAVLSSNEISRKFRVLSVSLASEEGLYCQTLREVVGTIRRIICSQMRRYGLEWTQQFHGQQKRLGLCLATMVGGLKWLKRPRPDPLIYTHNVRYP
jgi:hypothetical protein